MLIGIAIMGKIQTSEDINSALLYGILGILVGGIGFVIIYYDMAKDKLGRENDDLHLITTAHKQHTHEKGKISSWHMDQVPDGKVTLDKK